MQAVAIAKRLACVAHVSDSHDLWSRRITLKRSAKEKFSCFEGQNFDRTTFVKCRVHTLTAVDSEDDADVIEFWLRMWPRAVLNDAWLEHCNMASKKASSREWLADAYTAFYKHWEEEEVKDDKVRNTISCTLKVFNGIHTFCVPEPGGNLDDVNYLFSKDLLKNLPGLGVLMRSRMTGPDLWFVEKKTEFEKHFSAEHSCSKSFREHQASLLSLIRVLEKIPIEWTTALDQRCLDTMKVSTPSLPKWNASLHEGSTTRLSEATFKIVKTIWGSVKDASGLRHSKMVPQLLVCMRAFAQLPSSTSGRRHGEGPRDEDNSSGERSEESYGFISSSRRTGGAGRSRALDQRVGRGVRGSADAAAGSNNL